MEDPELEITEPIEWICCHYSDNGLIALLPVLRNQFNIAAVMDELTMRGLLSNDYTETYIKEEPDG